MQNRQMLLSFRVLSAVLTLSLAVLLPVRSICSQELEIDHASTSARIPWTQSRITGTPEPPLELMIEPAFPKLNFNDSIHVRWQPDLNRYFVAELSGKIWSFPHDSTVNQADLVVDLRADLQTFDTETSNGVQEVYSIVFDPDFRTNRFIYVCLVLSSKSGEPLESGVRVSRFTVEQGTPPRIDVTTELPVIAWRGGGHNGCDLVFDHSGCLLISTGDATGPSPPDILGAGQDVSNLLSSLLRIDVRGATATAPYKVPADNPFVSLVNARPEVWAYGFRNPWRIAIDPTSNDVWVGDVGWEKWELIHRVQRGGNYGWSVREGFELIQPDKPIGPTPILPPRVALSHAEAASITGGIVYQGNQLPSIDKHYLFGDWVNGRIWAVPTDGTGLEREVASAPLRIVAFGLDRDGQPLIVNHFARTTLYRLVPNPEASIQTADTNSFPQLLSETGLFADTAAQIPNPGVRPFTINQPQWSDGATSQYFLALPDRSQVKVYDSPQPFDSIAMFNGRMHYPPGAVLAKTIRWQDRPLETQVLHFDGRLWRGYSYAWNSQGSDATLVPAGGMEVDLPNDGHNRRWTIPGRSTCLQCHNPWSNFTLAFTPEQLHQLKNDGPSQWQQIASEGYVRTLTAAGQTVPAEKVVNLPLSSSLEADLERRARSYLHVNCAHCHQFGAGTGVAISLKHTDSDAEMNCFAVPPSKGQFEFPDGRLVAPGDPLRSVLLYRMASSTLGRMPHIGSREVDREGIVLIADWIQSLNASRNPLLNGNQQELAESPVVSLTERSIVEQTLDEVLSRARKGEPERELDQQENESLRLRIESANSVVASLLEGVLPASMRVQRMGPSATFADISGLVGNVDRGRQLFHDKNRLQCANCHHIADASIPPSPESNTANQLGPDLTQIGKRLSAPQLFEAIGEPSRQIEARYQSVSVLRDDGSVVVGIVERETTEHLVLRTAQNESITIPQTAIDQRQISTQSLMPSGLTQQLTAGEMADLIAYLQQSVP